jgi:hypothetical protein
VECLNDIMCQCVNVMNGYMNVYHTGFSTIEILQLMFIHFTMSQLKTGIKTVFYLNPEFLNPMSPRADMFTTIGVNIYI